MNTNANALDSNTILKSGKDIIKTKYGDSGWKVDKDTNIAYCIKVAITERIQNSCLLVKVSMNDTNVKHDCGKIEECSCYRGNKPKLICSNTHEFDTRNSNIGDDVKVMLILHYHMLLSVIKAMKLLHTIFNVLILLSWCCLQYLDQVIINYIIEVHQQNVAQL